MILELVALMVFWINALPPSPSIAGDLSPQHIVTGITVDYVKNSDFRSGSMPNYTKHTTIQCRPM